MTKECGRGTRVYSLSLCKIPAPHCSGALFLSDKFINFLTRLLGRIFNRYVRQQWREIVDIKKKKEDVYGGSIIM